MIPDPIHAAFDPVAYATPFFILTVILEIVLARFGKADARYEARDTAVSLGMGLGSSVAGVLFGALGFTAVVWVWQNHRIFDIPMTAWWAWIAVFLAEDLTYYWFHRLSHERRVWWLSHVNHHSSQHYNLSTALRQTWTGALNGSWALYVILSLLGFPPAMVAIQKGGSASSISTGSTPRRSGGCRPGSRRSSTRPRITACITPGTRSTSTATTPAS